MLWTISSYFNPVGYANRLRNYRIFRANLATPLAVVELSLNGKFELSKSDAEIVVQITGGDVLWQKERLLNLALRCLPDDCNHVAWVDCDVIFLDHDWARRADRALKEFRLIQPFRERCNLSRDARIFSGNDIACDSISKSVGYKIVMDEAQAEDFGQSNAPLTRNSTAGLAWAARCELLEAHGLYDACILGSTDRAILCAAMGIFESGVNAVGMRGRQIEHYLRWAEPFHRAVGGRVGFIDGRVLHLWHGDLRNRKYAERHEGLSRFVFDPFSDIVLDPSGCWRWNGSKPEMHEYVKAYFKSRKEDG
ncbi:MAG: hypothetical protein ACRD3B_16625 [Candidatus Sulfotelmatobacter sp.]